MNVQAAALVWLAEGRPAVVVEVAAHRGSVPREAGTRMLVSAQGVVGTIGGGHLELQAIERARAMLAGADVESEQSLALGPALGQCCGGALNLRYTALHASRPAAWPVPEPRFTLQLHGAGHVGRAIVRLLEGFACRVRWVDERDDAFPAEAGAPHVERVASDAPEAEVAAMPPGACYLVLTHSHDLDLRIAEAVLRRGDFAYCGLIGSRTKRARFLHRYQQRGVPAAALARLTCPIGIEGIEGKEPDVIAVAVVAQLLQVSGGLAARKAHDTLAAPCNASSSPPSRSVR